MVTVAAGTGVAVAQGAYETIVPVWVTKPVPFEPHPERARSSDKLVGVSVAR
jgi:hypothetical protein